MRATLPVQHTPACGCIYRAQHLVQFAPHLLIGFGRRGSCAIPPLCRIFRWWLSCSSAAMVWTFVDHGFGPFGPAHNFLHKQSTWFLSSTYCWQTWCNRAIVRALLCCPPSKSDQTHRTSRQLALYMSSRSLSRNQVVYCTWVDSLCRTFGWWNFAKCRQGCYYRRRSSAIVSWPNTWASMSFLTESVRRRIRSSYVRPQWQDPWTISWHRTVQ